MNSDASASNRGVEHSENRILFLPRTLLEPRRPGRAVAVGWLTAFGPSILLAAFVAALMPDSTQPDIKVDGTTALFLIVGFAPVVETLIMGGVLLVLLRLFSPPVAVAVSAAGWGVAHSLVALAWGLVIWWPFLVFSTLFVTWRGRSLAAAFALPAMVHALHNLPTALMLLVADRAFV